MDIIKVVCGIIYKEDKIFICRRSPHKSQGGLWEFPGGKVENGESNLDSLLRELQEELDMKAIPNNHFTTVVHDYDIYSIELIAYKCDFISASYNLTDHDAYRWINPSELLAYTLAPADIPIAVELIKEKERCI